jgi:hypothetical protein
MTKRRTSVEAPTPNPAWVPIMVGRMSVVTVSRPVGYLDDQRRTKRHARTSRDPGRVNLDELLDQRREVLPGELLQCLASVPERDPRERMARTGNASLAALRVIRSMFCTTQSIQPSVLSASSLDSPYQVGTTAGVRPCPCKPSSLQRGKAHSAAPSTRDPSAEVRKAGSWGLPIQSPSSKGCTACGP